MFNKILIQESVRGLIEFILRQGSIDNRFVSMNRAREGTIAHKKLQESNEKIYANYQKEVFMEYLFEFEKYILKIQGRADSIIIENNNVIIEEIKSTTREVNFIDEATNELHWAQGIIYGFIYATKNNLENITIRLSYINIISDEVKSFDRGYEYKELKYYVDSLVNSYKQWADLKQNLLEKRRTSIEELKFPFNTYRKGQKEFALICYNVIKENEVLFAQAPTGTGKTIATLFPALKSLLLKNDNRIVYLTAKTTTTTVVEKAINILIDKGLMCKSVTLTAKEKMCLNDKVECNPDACIYAKDFYSKLNDIVWSILSNESRISGEIVINYAKKYKMCPFELSLELTSWVDILICDYNYAFDPSARLIRIFEDTIQNNILLVDEGHNLVDRVKSSYSEELTKSEFTECKKNIKNKSKILSKVITNIIKFFNNLDLEIESNLDSYVVVDEQEKELKILLHMFIKECDIFIQQYNELSEVIIDLYFKCRRYLTVSEYYDENFRTLIKREYKDISIKVVCVNPKKNIKAITDKCSGAIVFSATFAPFEYYINLLGGDVNSYRFRLPSPFKKENLKVEYRYINLRYTHREKNISFVCNEINKFTSIEKGNYMIFFPSYEYMNKVYDSYIDLYGDEYIIKQKDTYTDIEKIHFINSFTNESNNIAFCITGGVFSEGIDLPGKKLIGAVIIGVGMPKISIEGNITKEFFGEVGFDYAYVYPGINKVLQAAGRVIRTENDKGRLLLIDDRYATSKYKKLLPQEWI